MKKGRLFGILMGIILIVAGIFLLDKWPIAGIFGFMWGIGMLIVVSIGTMRIGGNMKENFFHHAGSASECFQSDQAVPTNADVWNEICQKKGE